MSSDNHHNQELTKTPADQALQLYLDDLIELPVLPSKLVTELERHEEADKRLAAARLLLENAKLIDNELEKEDQTRSVSDAELGNQLELSLRKHSGDHKENSTIAETNNKGELRDANVPLQSYLPKRFQALLFEIAGVKIAMPLVELGSIMPMTQLTNMVKKPAWCRGVLIKDNDKYVCIDAASWLVPQKYGSDMPSSIEYKFAVQLGKSEYVLCCNNVSKTVELTVDDIKWRQNPQKRAWLAGVVTKEMCGLMDGARMVQEVLD